MITTEDPTELDICLLNCKYLWHVHIIHEDQQPLPHRGPVGLFGPLLHIGLQVPLEVH